MTTFNAALVKEQGVTFVVISVKDSVIDNRFQADELVGAMSIQFGCPAVLLGAQRGRLYGRDDLVRFLRHVHPSRLPWKQWSSAA